VAAPAQVPKRGSDDQAAQVGGQGDGQHAGAGAHQHGGGEADRGMRTKREHGGQAAAEEGALQQGAGRDGG
jgi:hypothetical protein